MSDTSTAMAMVPLAVRWEYRVVSIHARHRDVLQEALNEIGSEQWELMTINESVPNDWCCVFKRPQR